MVRLNTFITLCFIYFLLVANTFSQSEGEVHKEFEGIKSIRIEVVSGDCLIKQGLSDKVLVDIFFSVRPEKAFEPIFRERGDLLKIEERWRGYSSGGEVNWSLTVPAETEIEFSAASGDLRIEGLKSSMEANTASGDIEIYESQGEFEFNTASGDIEARKIRGEIDMHTASGDIKIRDAQGIFDLSCASGDIDASAIVIEEESSFSTASGDVEVKLAKSSEYDLELSASSGDVLLDYNGNPITGYFEFSARERRGQIKSPYDFDDEKEFHRNGNTYLRKSFTRGNGKPKIFLETASGKVTLR